MHADGQLQGQYDGGHRQARAQRGGGSRQGRNAAKDFVEIFFGPDGSVVDPTERRPTKPAPPSRSLPASNWSASSSNLDEFTSRDMAGDFYEDWDGTKFYFSPAHGLTRAPTVPSSKRMRGSQSRETARQCNNEISSKSRKDSRSAEMLPTPGVELEEKTYVILRSNNFNVVGM